MTVQAANRRKLLSAKSDDNSHVQSAIMSSGHKSLDENAEKYGMTRKEYLAFALKWREEKFNQKVLSVQTAYRIHNVLNKLCKALAKLQFTTNYGVTTFDNPKNNTRMRGSFTFRVHSENFWKLYKGEALPNLGGYFIICYISNEKLTEFSIINGVNEKEIKLALSALSQWVNELKEIEGSGLADIANLLPTP